MLPHGRMRLCMLFLSVVLAASYRLSLLQCVRVNNHISLRSQPLFDEIIYSLSGILCHFLFDKLPSYYS